MNTSPRESDETKCHYVSSLGLVKICNYYSSRQDPCHDTKFIDANATEFVDTDISALQGKLVIQLCYATFERVLKTLNKENVRVVIVLNNEDYEFPTHYTSIMNVIDQPWIVHMFVQNCVIIHPKISKLPIALAYHTFNILEPYRCPELLPVDHEKLLVNIQNNSLPFWKRKQICYCNFQLAPHSRYGYDRQDALQKLNKDLCFFLNERRSRSECYSEMSEYTFVISPLGNGLDCHRTWEALVLGCIPIVKSQKTQDLFDDLPVLIVNDWSDINRTLLDMTIAYFKTRKFNMEKLTLSYWKNLIYSKLN